MKKVNFNKYSSWLKDEVGEIEYEEYKKSYNIIETILNDLNYNIEKIEDITTFNECETIKNIIDIEFEKVSIRGKDKSDLKEAIGIYKKFLGIMNYGIDASMKQIEFDKIDFFENLKNPTEVMCFYYDENIKCKHSWKKVSERLIQRLIEDFSFKTDLKKIEDVLESNIKIINGNIVYKSLFLKNEDDNRNYLKKIKELMDLFLVDYCNINIFYKNEKESTDNELCFKENNTMKNLSQIENNENIDNKSIDDNSKYTQTIFKTISMNEANEKMKEWKETRKLPELNSEYMMTIRNDLENIVEKVKKEIENENIKLRKDYCTDVRIGARLYTYLNKFSCFNNRLASNDGFWRFLSLEIAPHLVSERWGYDNEDHFWKRSSRIWFRAIWWYINLSWQGNVEDTICILESECFQTDTILNLEERTGREGIYISVCRELMKVYSSIPYSDIKALEKKQGKKKSLFRIIMKINTAKLAVVEPGLYDGGVIGYVKSLFEDAGAGKLVRNNTL